MTPRKPGATVDAIPAPIRPSKSKINWDHYANVAMVTGKSVLAGKKVRETQIKALRQYDRPPFRDNDGHIAITMRHSAINPDDGVRYGDVYFTWVPNETTTPKEGN